MTFDQFVQVHMFGVGVLAIYGISGQTHTARRFGFAVGLFNQWCWWYWAISTEAWGMLGLNCIYAVMYVRGFRNTWRQL